MQAIAPRGIAIGLITAALLASAVPAVATATVDTPTGLSQILAAKLPTDVIRGIAEFDSVPTSAQVAGLAALGLKVQPMHELPLALVKGSVAQITQAVNSRAANDIYPDEQIQLLDTASSDAMGAAAVRAAGYTGKGVTVGIVDSGCDASHPDLANRVTHNVILVSAEYYNGRDAADNTIIVPTETGPYQNSDLSSGHGTHVAGIVAADGHTGANHLGVAPDANLACFSIGSVLFTTAVVTAYDVMLRQPNMWGIRVVNNSWGNDYRMFDPNDPVSVATKAVVAHGATVVFASGNAGPDEMSLNPFSEAPWVISVGAGNLNHKLANFSSVGQQFDNSQEGYIGAGGHTVYTGDRIGLYHPDVVAPGVAISSSCDTTGTVIGPCPPGQNAEADGTSMASPHIAGAAAVLLQANPRLTPVQVQQALQATATPITDANGAALPFWRVGYGYVDLAKAVALVTRSDWKTKLSSTSNAADQRVLQSDGYKVTRSDWWTYDAPRIAVAGTDSQSYTVDVPTTTKFLKIALSHPSLAAVGANFMKYDVTVKDVAGNTVAVSHELGSAGTSEAFVDLSKVSPAVKYGTFTISVSGQRSISDPDSLDSDSLLGRMITLEVAQLIAGK
jgi:serine protease AprX